MSVMLRILILTRSMQLLRQLREVQRVVDALPVSAQRAAASLAMQEMRTAARDPLPHLYGSQQADRYQPWGDTAEQALGRARSGNPQLQLRGLALWLAVVFHETRDSQHPAIRAVHREVLGILGRIKGTYEAAAVAKADEAQAEADAIAERTAAAQRRAA